MVPQLLLHTGALDQAHVDEQRTVDLAEVVHGVTCGSCSRARSATRA